MFVTLNKYFWQSCCQNKAKGHNCKLIAFQVNSRQRLKSLSFVTILQNGSTEVRRKWLTLNYYNLKTAKHRKFKFGENAF